MKKKASWIWQIHFIIYLYMALEKACEFFLPTTEINMYYHILIAYDTKFLFVYCRNALSVILNLFALFPFFLFIYRRSFLSKEFWLLFVLCRLLFDLTGRSYEIGHLVSYFYQSTRLGTTTVFLVCFIYLPSYLANFHYAFRKDPDPGQNLPSSSH